MARSALTGGTHSSYAAATIGAAATLLVPARAGRLSLMIQNLHATQTLHIGPDANILTTNAFRLGANDSVDINYQGDIYVIGSGAGTNIVYWETW